MTTDQTQSVDGGTSGDRGGLQAITENGPLPRPAGLVADVLWHARHICLIDIRTVGGTKPLGTGFLVGPDLVLTAYHVIEDPETLGEIAPKRLRCCFDFRHTGSGVSFGSEVDVLQIVKTRPPSQAERAGTYVLDSTQHPRKMELDYALLRLKRRVGEEDHQVRDERRPRGWIQLRTARPDVPQNGDLYILQHPLGDPIKLAEGAVLPKDRQPTDTRLRHNVSTLAGSSGSPCFQFPNNGEQPVVVGLHTYGDPNWRAAEFNHAIPIELIARDLGELIPAEPTSEDDQKRPPPPPPVWQKLLAAAATALGAVALAFWLNLPCYAGVACPKPEPIVEPASFAWFFPYDHADKNSPTAMVLNVRFKSTQDAVFSRVRGQLLMGGPPIEINGTQFIDMKETCLYSRYQNCITAPVKLRAVARSPEFSVLFAAARWKSESRAYWGNMVNIFHAGVLPRIGYTVEYYVKERVRLESFECELPHSLIEAIQADKRFDAVDNLRPAVAALSLSCKRV